VANNLVFITYIRARPNKLIECNGNLMDFICCTCRHCQFISYFNFHLYINSFFSFRFSDCYKRNNKNYKL